MKEGRLSAKAIGWLQCLGLFITGAELVATFASLFQQPELLLFALPVLLHAAAWLVGGALSLRSWQRGQGWNLWALRLCGYISLCAAAVPLALVTVTLPGAAAVLWLCWLAQAGLLCVLVWVCDEADTDEREQALERAKARALWMALPPAALAVLVGLNMGSNRHFVPGGSSLVTLLLFFMPLVWLVLYTCFLFAYRGGYSYGRGLLVAAGLLCTAMALALFLYARVALGRYGGALYAASGAFLVAAPLAHLVVWRVLYGPLWKHRAAGPGRPWLAVALQAIACLWLVRTAYDAVEGVRWGNGWMALECLGALAALVCWVWHMGRALLGRKRNLNVYLTGLAFALAVSIEPLVSVLLIGLEPQAILLAIGLLAPLYWTLPLCTLLVGLLGWLYYRSAGWGLHSLPQGKNEPRMEGQADEG